MRGHRNAGRLAGKLLLVATAALTAAGLGLLAVNGAAGVRQVIPDITGVPGAALHTLTAGDHVMALVATGLLTGSGGWRTWWIGIGGLAFGFAGGLGDMLLGSSIPFARTGALMVALVIALATAFNLRPGVTTAFLVAALTGALMGNGAIGQAQGWSALATTGAGTLIGVVVTEAVPGLVSALFKRGWPHVLVRVVASSIAVSSLTVLAFALAPLLRG